MDTQLLLDALALQHIQFEKRLILIFAMILLAIVLIPITAHYWVRLVHKYVKRHPDAKYVFQGHESIKHVFHDVSFIVKLVLIMYACFIVWQTAHQSPVIAATSPVLYSKLETTAPSIQITFEEPVDKDNITFHVSPVIEGEWLWERPQIQGMYRTVRFIPAESFLPDSRIVVYMVGVRPIWDKNQSHEMAIEFTAPRTPKLVGTFPPDGQEDVPPNTQILLEYDEPLGDFVETDVVIKPSPGEFVVFDHDTKQTIEFSKLLEQDQAYEISVHQTIRSYDTKTGEDRVRGETKRIERFSFTTVATPLVDSYSPKGTAVLPQTPLTVVFDQEMNQDSVSERFDVSPATEGESEWTDERTFVFTPNDGWDRGTEYSVRFAKGMKGISGGVIDEMIELSFTTIGAVKVTGISPHDGASGVDPQKNDIQITFDQPVNKESAASAVSITPSVEYSTTWVGNSLVLQTSGKLAHNTGYTIAITKGIVSVHGLDSTDTYSSTFTTKPKTFVLGVPYYSQEETFTCNIASARMALAYRGVYLDEDSVQEGVGYSDNPNNGWVNGYGVHVGPVANFVDNYRSVSVKQGWNLTDMLKEVQKGNPVIIWEYNRYSQPYGSFTLASGATGYMGMHSEVVKGFIGSVNNPTHILTNDPWRGQLTYTVDTFNNVWSYLNNTALIVY